MSRRRDRQRRRARKGRDPQAPDPGPPAMTLALARWTGILETARAPGSEEPILARYLVLVRTA